MDRGEALKTIETPETQVTRFLKVGPRRESANLPVSDQMAGGELESLYGERAAILEYDCGPTSGAGRATGTYSDQRDAPLGMAQPMLG